MLFINIVITINHRYHLIHHGFHDCHYRYHLSNAYARKIQRVLGVRTTIRPRMDRNFMINALGMDIYKVKGNPAELGSTDRFGLGNGSAQGGQ